MKDPGLHIKVYFLKIYLKKQLSQVVNFYFYLIVKQLQKFHNSLILFYRKTVQIELMNCCCEEMSMVRSYMMKCHGTKNSKRYKRECNCMLTMNWFLELYFTIFISKVLKINMGKQNPLHIYKYLPIIYSHLSLKIYLIEYTDTIIDFYSRMITNKTWDKIV